MTDAYQSTASMLVAWLLAVRFLRRTILFLVPILIFLWASTLQRGVPPDQDGALEVDLGNDHLDTAGAYLHECVLAAGHLQSVAQCGTEIQKETRSTSHNLSLFTSGRMTVTLSVVSAAAIATWFFGMRKPMDEAELAKLRTPNMSCLSICGRFHLSA